MTASATTGRVRPTTAAMGLRLRRNAVWMFLGQGGYAAGQWAILVILAQLGGPMLLGQFSLALAITGPIVIFSQLQMRQILVVDATGRYPFADYRAVRFVTTALALSVIAAVAALGGYPALVAAVILAVGLTRAVENLSDIYYGLAQRHEQLDRVAQSMLLRTLVGCAALGLVLELTGSLIAGLLAQTVAWAAVWWLFDRRIAPPSSGDGDGGPPPRSGDDDGWGAFAARPSVGGDGSDDGDARRRALSRRLQLAWLGLPLGGSMMLGILSVNVPRYVIEGFLGFEALGIFAALTHFVLAGSMVINAICQAASPQLANLFAAGELGPFRRLLFQLCAAGALLGLAGVLVALPFGAPLLALLYGEAFAAHAELLVLVLGMGVVYYATTPLGYGLSAMHRFRVQPVLQGLALAVNVVACLVLVPRYGLAGAVVGWSAAFIGLGLMTLVLNARYLRRAPAP